MIKTGKVVNFRKNNSVNFFAKNKTLFFLCFVFIIGLIFSCLTFKTNVKNGYFEKIFEFLYLKRIKFGFFKIFLNSLLLWISVLTVYFLFGTSVVGVCTVPLFTFCLGFIFGGISSLLYTRYALKGIAFNALLIIPPVILFLSDCFFAGKSSLVFSFSLANLTVVKGKSVNLCEKFKKFCGEYLIFAGLIAVVCLFDTVLSVLFIKFFDF